MNIPESEYGKTEPVLKTYPSYPSALSEPSDQELLRQHRAKPASVIDQMAAIQKIINKEESDTCAIMSTPAGARMINWSYVLRDTWWFKLFSRIDRNYKKRVSRLS